MGGTKAPAPPAPQPVTPVPQPDDPKSLETERNAARAAERREGATAHLLSNPMGGAGTLGTGDEESNFKRRSTAMVS
jgi:hypothetical protein